MKICNLFIRPRWKYQVNYPDGFKSGWTSSESTARAYAVMFNGRVFQEQRPGFELTFLSRVLIFLLVLGLAVFGLSWALGLI